MQNPLPDRPDHGFVHGDLAEESVLRRAGLHRARRVLIDAHDDEALTLTVAVAHVSPGAHIVVTLQDMARAHHVSSADDEVQCVQWHSPLPAGSVLYHVGGRRLSAEEIVRSCTP